MKMLVKFMSKDLIFLRHLCWYLNLLLITPWYNFNTNSFQHLRWSKVYGIFLLSIKTFLIVYSILDESIQHLYGKMFFSQKLFFSGSCIIVTVLNVVTIFNCCYCKLDQWKTLFTNLHSIQEKVHTGVWKNLYVTIVTKHTVFVLFLLYIYYVWSNVMGVAFYKVAILSGFMELYYEFLIILLITSLVGCLKRRYEQLNDNLRKLRGRNNLEIVVHHLIRDYRTLAESVEIFNTLFGYQIILIIFHCGLTLINSLNFTFLRLVINIDDRFYQHSLVSNVCFLVIILVSVILSETLWLLSFLVQFSFCGDPCFHDRPRSTEIRRLVVQVAGCGGIRIEGDGCVDEAR